MAQTEPMVGRPERVCWAILAAAMAVSAALLMYLSRGTTFNVDELVWVHESAGLGPLDVLDPFNGSLIATNRILYKAILETVGAEYVAFRAMWVASVLLASGTLYALIKRWIGALPALAPAILLLFFGSSGSYFTGPIGFVAIFAIATGLGALLALERHTRGGDVAACVLLIVSVATFSIGLGFLAGAAVSVLLRADRSSRVWIFLVPLGLYAAWWLASLGSSGSSTGEVTASNILIVPSYVVDSLAASLAALTGLNYDFGSSEVQEGIGWGYVIGAISVGALGVRFARGRIPSSVWVSLAVILTVWTAGALSYFVFRAPESARYMYMGAVGVILVGAAAASTLRFTRTGLLILFGVTGASLMTNLALLRDNAAATRAESAQARVSFTMLDLARGEVSPDYVPPVPGYRINPEADSAGPYLTASERYGSFGISLQELEREGLALRELADQTLVGAQELEPRQGAEGVAQGPCRQHEAGDAGIELPPEGATLVAEGAGSLVVRAGRFAPPSVDLGRLDAGEPATLEIAPDSYPRPWLASVAGARSVEVCSLR